MSPKKPETGAKKIARNSSRSISPSCRSFFFCRPVRENKTLSLLFYSFVSWQKFNQSVRKRRWKILLHTFTVGIPENVVNFNSESSSTCQSFPKNFIWLWINKFQKLPLLKSNIRFITQKLLENPKQMVIKHNATNFPERSQPVFRYQMKADVFIKNFHFR